MKKILIPTFLFFSALTSFAQEWTLRLSSNVELRTWKLTTKADKEEVGLGGASITLTKGGAVVSQSSSESNGDFTVMVPPNDEFILTVSYAGCNTKKFLINTKGVPDEVGKDNYKPSFSIGGFVMAKPFPGIDYSGLQQSLVKVEYKPKGKNFDHDDVVTENGLDIVSKIATAENILIEKFCSTNKAGDVALAKPDCPLAKMLYEKAIALIPGEQYPVVQLAKVGLCLKDKEEAAKKAAEEAAAKIAADKAAAEKALADKAAKEKADKEKAESDKLAKEKAEKEKSQKAETEKLAKEKADKEKAEADKIAKEKADKEKGEKAEADKLAKEKADKEKAEKAETERLAKEKNEKEKGEADKLAKEKAEKEKSQKAETDKLAKEKADKEKTEKAEAERLAKEKANKDKSAEKLAKEKAAKEKEDAERIAKAKEAEEKEAKRKEAMAKSNKEGERDRVATEGDTKKLSYDNKAGEDGGEMDKRESKRKMPQVLGANKYKETITKADGYFKTKRYKEAKTAYEEALQLKENDVYATNKIADCDKLIAPK